MFVLSHQRREMQVKWGSLGVVVMAVEVGEVEEEATENI
jgi:hypothetical protein